MRPVEALYKDGVLRPTKPLSLRAGETVNLIVVRRPDRSRWDMERLARAGSGEDLALAQENLEDWADALDREDVP